MWNFVFCIIFINLYFPQLLFPWIYSPSFYNMYNFLFKLMQELSPKINQFTFPYSLTKDCYIKKTFQRLPWQPRFYTSTGGGISSVCSWGTKIFVVWPEKRKKENFPELLCFKSHFCWIFSQLIVYMFADLQGPTGKILAFTYN